VVNVEVNGAALAAIRERSGLRNADLASLAGITPSYLTQMENAAGTKAGYESADGRVCIDGALNIASGLPSDRARGHMLVLKVHRGKAPTGTTKRSAPSKTSSSA
jgi:hypothetical protein